MKEKKEPWSSYVKVWLGNKNHKQIQACLNSLLVAYMRKYEECFSVDLYL